MVTEQILTAIYETVIGIIATLLNQINNAVPNAPDYQFPIPEPLWFIVQYVLINVGIIYPIVLAYWAWRQFKA